MEAEFFISDEKANMTTLIDAFLNFANALKSNRK
jgi:hypothetical protein